MKGPRSRRQFHVRRIWECPVCHRRERTGGDVVNRVCPCQARVASPAWMRLVEDTGQTYPRRREPPSQDTVPGEDAPEQPA